jgi:hypothetical protein
LRSLSDLEGLVRYVIMRLTKLHISVLCALGRSFIICTLHQVLLDENDGNKKHETGGALITYGKDQKCLQNFSRKKWKEEIAWTPRLRWQYIVTCQCTAKQRVDKHPAIHARNNGTTELCNPLLGNGSAKTLPPQEKWRHTPTVLIYHVTCFLCGLRYATVGLFFLCCPCRGYITRVRLQSRRVFSWVPRFQRDWTRNGNKTS